MKEDLEGIMRKLNITPEEISTFDGDTSHHECDDGWLYTDAGDAIRCPTCQAASDAQGALDRIKRAGIGDRYVNTTWDTLDMVEPLPALKAASDQITRILAKGDHLLLTGPPGSGKTQAAVLLAKDAINDGHGVHFLNLGRTAMEIRAAYKTDNGPTEAQIVNLCSTVDLLIVDDLGAGESGNAAIEQRLLYLILETRQNERRSTVLTTNLTPKEVSDRLGARLIGRLQPLEVMAFRHGRNFRRPEGATAWRVK